MDLSQRKEQFSNAWLRAIAAVAGYTLAKPDTDDDSVDYTLSARNTGGFVRRPKVDVQLKATARTELLGADELRYPLSIKNYDDLRPLDLLVPRLLVVVVLPAEASSWLEQTEEELVLRRCAYWCSLRGEPASDSTSTVTVSVPRTQRLTPTSLQGIMARVDAGGVP